METPYTVAAAVLAHVQSALLACGRACGRNIVAVGQITVDACCEGLLAVAPERTYRTVAPFPTEALADAQCTDSPIAVPIVVSLYRCIPVMDDRGEPPTDDVLAVAYAAILSDAAIVWNAVSALDILGVDSVGDPIWERASVSQEYPAAGADCIGSETRLTVGIPAGLWCPPCIAPPVP